MKKFNNLLILLIVTLMVFTFGKSVFAQEVCGEVTSAQLVFRDDMDEFIGDISFEIYTQIVDVDGNPKPGTKLVAGKTSNITGRGEVVINKLPYDGYFVVKAWDKNSTIGAFWYYNELLLSCGQPASFEKVLSGIRFVFRDTESNLMKDIVFSVYTQRYDVDNNPIKEKEDFVYKLNTSLEGEAVLYLANKETSLDGKGSDFYVFETCDSCNKNGTFILYDMRVLDERMTEVEYVFADFKLTLKDINGVPFPASTKVDVYKQDYDASGKMILGDFIKSINTDDNGVAVFVYPPEVYAARIKGENDQYQELWNLEIIDQERQYYDLYSNDTWDPGTGACSQTSAFTLYTTDINGTVISGLNFEIYEEEIDLNGALNYGKKISAGKIDDYGKGFVSFNPDPRKKYVLKIYETNSSVGDFWFFDRLQFVCGKDQEVQKYLPYLSIILRDGNGDLKKNQKFSIYTQKFDTDDKPIKEKKDLVGNFTTSDRGEVKLYLSPDHPYKKDKKGSYVFVSTGVNKKDYIEYNIKMNNFQNTVFEYVLSDLILELKNPEGKIMSNFEIGFYAQDRNLDGDYVLGSSIKNIKTDSSGKALIEYPSGYYAISYKDDFGQMVNVWDVYIKNNTRTQKTITTNLTKVFIKDEKGSLKLKDTAYSVYSMKEGDGGNFFRDKLLKSGKIEEAKYDELILASAPYLFVYKEGNVEYGKALYVEQNKKQEVYINANESEQFFTGKGYKLAVPKEDNSFADNLKGYILLQVEEKGEAWYVNPKDGKKYYMKDGEVAYKMMRDFGLGIKNNDLSKISVGLDSRLNELDSDKDGVHDKMEEALGTNAYKKDSDGDGYIDGAEIGNGYNPKGSGRQITDQGLSNSLKGKILLQVESRGEAWYINPKDGKRYYMKDGDSAFEIMRFLSLGITNFDLDKIKIGNID